METAAKKCSDEGNQLIHLSTFRKIEDVVHNDYGNMEALQQLIVVMIKSFWFYELFWKWQRMLRSALFLVQLLG